MYLVPYIWSRGWRGKPCTSKVEFVSYSIDGLLQNVGVHLQQNVTRINKINKYTGSYITTLPITQKSMDKKVSISLCFI